MLVCMRWECGGCRERINADDGTDFKAVAAVVDATHRYKEIFYGYGDE